MTDAQPLRIAVVGTNIGCTLHVRALRGAGFDLAALVGRDPERTRARADYFGIPGALGSVEAALDSDSDIDAIVIASPPATHHPFTMKAIAAGKHVLCEKSFADDVGQAREMRDASREAGVVGQIVHEHRWFAHHATFRHLVRSGALGDPLQAAFIFDHFLIARGVGELPDWWLHHETGGGWLRNYASHGIDLVRYMIGDFAAVSGLVHNDPSRGMSADDGYAFAFQLTNGAQGVMTGSCRSWDFCAVSRLTGTRATGSFDRDSVSVVDAEGVREVDFPDHIIEDLRGGGPNPGAPSERLPEAASVYEQTHSSGRGYAEEVGLSRTFRNRILDRSYQHTSVATFDDGVGHMEVIHAVEEFARTRRWVDLGG